MLSRVSSIDPHRQLTRISEDIEALSSRAEVISADLPEMTRHIAQLWSTVAELDPELATRLGAYCPDLMDPQSQGAATGLPPPQHRPA